MSDGTRTLHTSITFLAWFEGGKQDLWASYMDSDSDFGTKPLIFYGFLNYDWAS